MSSQVDDIVQAVRAHILSGRFTAGQKLTEAALSDSIGCSRTLIRLALSALESEGLVDREPNRGCRVRAFTLDEITDAILVRGELEGMAARTAAERGLTQDDAAAMAELLDEMDALLEQGFATLERQTSWIDLNENYHDAIVSASRNMALGETISGLSRLPLVSSRGIVFDHSDPAHSARAIGRAHEDHHQIFEAISRREGARAEALMRDHARRSAANKRNSIDAMKSGRLGPRLPGIDLVAVG